MKKYLKLEYERVIRSKRFWLIIFIGLFIALMQYSERGGGWRFEDASILYTKIEFTQNTPLPWYEYWMGGEGFGFYTETFFLIFPILAVIPLGYSLVSDNSTGYTIHMFTLGKRKHYYSARFISAFLVGGIVVAFPLIVNMLLYLGGNPSICPEPANGTSPIITESMWALLYYTHPIIYEILYVMIDFVFGGIFSCFAAAIGLVTKNKFLPIIFPFVLYVFLDTIFAIQPSKILRGYSPHNFLPPSQHSGLVSFDKILIVAIILLIPTIAIFVWNARKNETL